MADDPNPTLRGQLVDALAVLAPQIRGLHDLVATSISAELANEINKQIEARERRRNLINTVIQWLDGSLHALNALEADGYPKPPAVPTMAAELMRELSGEETDLDAAVAVFDQPPSTIALGSPTFTTQPAPTQPGP